MDRTLIDGSLDNQRQRCKEFHIYKGEVRRVQPILFKAGIIITITNGVVRRGRLKIYSCLKYILPLVESKQILCKEIKDED